MLPSKQFGHVVHVKNHKTRQKGSKFDVLPTQMKNLGMDFDGDPYYTKSDCHKDLGRRIEKSSHGGIQMFLYIYMESSHLKVHWFLKIPIPRSMPDHPCCWEYLPSLTIERINKSTLDTSHKMV